MSVTNVLQNQVGIQYQGVQDKSEANPQQSLINSVVSGVFRRGRLDKPFAVTKENYRALLGHDPNNPYYLAVEDALTDGAPMVCVMRIGESNYPLEGTNVLFRAATDQPVSPNVPVGPPKETRISSGVRWSETGKYLFAHDSTTGSPSLRWFVLDPVEYCYNELTPFVNQTGTDWSCPHVATNLQETVVALWNSNMRATYRPEVLDISDPSNVKLLTLDPPIPFPDDPFDTIYQNGIRQVQFSEDGLYMVHVVYGNMATSATFGRVAVYKRNNDRNGYTLLQRIHKVHSSDGVAFSIVGNIMRIVSNLGNYLYAYILNLDTLQLTSIPSIEYDVNSGSYDRFIKVTDYQFIGETQYEGFALITFPQDHTNTTLSYAKLPGNYGGSRYLTYSFNRQGGGVAEGTVQYYGQSYNNDLIAGEINVNTNQNTYTVDNISANWPEYTAPDYFDQPRLSPAHSNLMAFHTKPNFFGAKNFINFIKYDPQGSPRYKIADEIKVNYLPGMEFI